MTLPEERVKSLLRGSIIHICCNQLTFCSHLQIKANVQVIVDNQDTLTMFIDENVKPQHSPSNNVGDGHKLNGGNDVRNAIEKSLFQAACDMEMENGVTQLIKEEAENSLVGRLWQAESTKWVTVQGVHLSNEAQSRQAEMNTISVSESAELNTNLTEKPLSEGLGADRLRQISSGKVTDNQQSNQSHKIQVENSDTLNLSPSYQLAESEADFNEVEQSEADFNSSSDPRHIEFDAEYVTDHQEIESEARLLTSDGHVGEMRGKQKDLTEEARAVLTAVKQLSKEGARYKCPKCEFFTEHGSAMNAHLKAHKKIVPCEHCGEMFSSVTALRQHMYDEHGISHRRRTREIRSKMECKFCKHQCKTTQELSQHLSECHSSESGVCPYCDNATVHAANLQQHIQKHCISSRWKCKSCDMLCVDKHHLQLHVEQEHRMDSCVVCELCGVSMKGPLMLKLHIKSIHNQHKCLGCGFSSTRLETFEKHQCVGDREKLCCRICLCDNFVCLTQLKRHMKQQHPMDHKKRQCDFCSKVFCSRQGLYTHRKVVHGSQMDGTKREVFTCHICGKGFPIFKYLKGHLKSHEDAEPYKCPKCQKTFKYHRNFKTHKQGCINPSGYPCPICSKTLKNEYSLKVHVNGVHNKTAKFPCRKCGMPFSHLPTRTSHEKSCSEETLPTGGV